MSISPSRTCNDIDLKTTSLVKHVLWLSLIRAVDKSGQRKLWKWLIWTLFIQPLALVSSTTSFLHEPKLSLENVQKTSEAFEANIKWVILQTHCVIFTEITSYIQKAIVKSVIFFCLIFFWLRKNYWQSLEDFTPSFTEWLFVNNGTVFKMSDHHSSNLPDTSKSAVTQKERNFHGFFSPTLTITRQFFAICQKYSTKRHLATVLNVHTASKTPF